MDDTSSLVPTNSKPDTEAADVSSLVKKEAVLKIKRTQEHKDLEDFIRNSIGRPFMRRLPYWFIGPNYNIPDNTYLFGNVLSESVTNLKDPGLAFGAVNQALGFLTTTHVDDTAALDQLLTFLTLKTPLSNTIIAFNAFSALLAKAKFDLSALTLEWDEHGIGSARFGAVLVPIAYPHTLISEMTLIASWVKTWTDVAELPESSTQMAYVPYAHKDDIHLVPVQISAATLTEQFGAPFTKPLRFVAIRGYDMLDFRFLEKAKKDTDLKQYYSLYRQAPKVVRYAHRASLPERAWTMFRTDMFLILSPDGHLNFI